MAAEDDPEVAFTPAEGLDDVAPAASPPLPPSPRSGRRISAASGEPGGSGPLTAGDMERLQCQQESPDPFFNLDKLRAVFDGMATANGGRITLDQLPFVLVGSEVAASPKEIEDTIAELLPDADDGDALIDFDQVETIYLKLCRDVMQPAAEDPSTQLTARRPALWRRAWQWLRWRCRRQSTKQTAYEKHMRPTTRLLLVILAAASAISLGIVIFSIVMIFDHSVDQVRQNVLREVVLLRDGLEVFGYAVPLNRSTDRMQQLAAVLGTLLEDFGFQGNKAVLEVDLTSQQRMLSVLLDGWFVTDVKSRATLKARLLKGCVQYLSATQGESTAIAVVNQLNPTLPKGQEVVLSRSAGSAAEYATELRFGNECQTTNCTTGGRLDAASLAALNGSTGVLFGTDYRSTAVVAGYTYVPGPRLGLVYNTELAGLQDWFADVAAGVVTDINAAANLTSNVTGTRDPCEYVLARRAAATGQTLIAAGDRACGAACPWSAAAAGTVLALALNGTAGIADTQGLAGGNATAAYGGLPASGLALAVQEPSVVFMADLYQGAAVALGAMNARLNDTEEVQLAVADSSSVNGIRFVTAFAHPCNGTCGATPGTSPFLVAAVADRAAGVMQDVPDHRGATVMAGYSYVPSLAAGVAVKIDQQAIVDSGVALVSTILNYETDVRFA
eukprot:EG_transcript_5736